MWKIFISVRISSSYYPWLQRVKCRETFSLLKAGGNVQAAILPNARVRLRDSCFGFLVKPNRSNNICYQAICNNIRSYSTRKNRYISYPKSFLQRIPREILVLVLVGITGGVIYGWNKKYELEKFDVKMDEINKIIKRAQDLDIDENQKEKAIKLYDNVLKKVKIEISSEQSLRRMSALTTKYVFIVDQLANLMHGLGKLNEAEDYYKQSLQALLSHGASKDDDAVIEISLKLASIYAEENRHELAENGFSWCVENARKKVNENERLNVNSSALLGICLESYGKYLLSRKRAEKAISLLSEALEISRNIFGEKHEQVVLLVNNLGVSYFEAGDMEHSKTLFKEAINLSTKEKHRDLWSFHLNLANVLSQTGYTEEAQQEYMQAIKLCHSETTRNNIEDQLRKFT